MNRSSREFRFGGQSPARFARRSRLAPRLIALCGAAIALGAANASGAPAAASTASVTPAAETSAGDDWVERGQKAFRGDVRSAPWYDAESDSVRPVRVRAAANWKLPRWLNLFGWLGLPIKIGAYALLAALVVGLVWLLIRGYLNRERSALESADRSVKRRRLETADRVEALPFDVQAGFDDLPGAARRLYAEGRYSEAIVYLFSHELCELDRHQHIRLAKGKTNRQYLRELAGKADLRSLLGNTMDLFERAFFGGERLDRASFEVCWNELSNFAALAAKEPG